MYLVMNVMSWVMNAMSRIMHMRPLLLNVVSLVMHVMSLVVKAMPFAYASNVFGSGRAALCYAWDVFGDACAVVSSCM